MKVKKSKFIKFFIVCLIAVFGFFSINAIVNADSIYESSDYEDISHYNWDNIIWTDSQYNKYITGSNDTNSLVNNFSDSYVCDFDSGLIGATWTGSYSTAVTINGYYDLIFISNNEMFYGIEFYSAAAVILYRRDGGESPIYAFEEGWNESYRTIRIVGGSDVNNSTLIDWFNRYGSFSDGGNSNDFYVSRDISLNSNLSNDNYKVFDCGVITDLYFTEIIFEKSDFFLKVGDLNSIISPMVYFTTIGGGYNISYDIEGYVNLKSGSFDYIRGVTTSKEDLLGWNYLLPSKTDLFGTTNTIDNDSLMYIKNIRVGVTLRGYVDFYYRYGVSDILTYEDNYGNAIEDWVNKTGVSSLGNSLLSSVNGFLAFEIVPGLTLMNILVLLVVVPLLIWILRLFLGG